MIFFASFSSPRKCIHKPYYFHIYVHGICTILRIATYFFIIILQNSNAWGKDETDNYDTMYVRETFLETATYIELVNGK